MLSINGVIFLNLHFRAVFVMPDTLGTVGAVMRPRNIVFLNPGL